MLEHPGPAAGVTPVPVIDVHELTKQFGTVTAVDRVSFAVGAGEIFGLLGPNGAGKTTAMRMLCCLISKSSGEATIAGYAIGDAAASLRIRKLLGLVPENVGLYEELSAFDNLDFYARLYECPQKLRRDRIEHFLRLLELWESRDRPVGDFSKGMKQKVAIARALVHDPVVLVLDEPTANLDPESATVVRNTILGLKKQGKTVVLSTHNLDEAQRICDRIGILRTRLLAVAAPEELKRSVWGNRTVVQLAQVSEPVLAAVQKLKLGTVTVDGNQLIVDVADPLQQNPVLAEAIVSAGGRVQFITRLNPDLEETYLRIVQETS